MSWGSPSPVIGTPGYSSSYALDPNGDSMYGSGVVSHQNFVLSGGIRVEWWGKGTQSYTYWQSFGVGISPVVADSFYSDPEPGSIVYIHTGAEYAEDSIYYGVVGLGTVYTEPYPDDNWHHYAFEISQGGAVSFWRDEVFKYETAPGAIDFSVYDNLPIQVAGRSYNDPQLIDDLCVMTGPVGIEDTAEKNNRIPKSFSLHQNYPNPFNPMTTIQVDIPVGELLPATLVIYNLRGQRVRMLVDRTLSGGTHLFSWEGRNDTGQPVPSGIYIYIMKRGTNQSLKKMVLLK